MTNAGETDHDRELQKAFAEFKESLRHDPRAPHDADGPKLAAPEIVIAEPRRPLTPLPKVDTRPVLGAGLSQAATDLPSPAATRAAPSEGRRRSLLYLSAAIVVSGLAAVGWTLTHGARPGISAGEPATAAVAPETPSSEAATTTENPTAPATAETPPPETPQTAATPTEAPAAQPPATTAEQSGAPDKPAAETQKAALTPPAAAEPAPPLPAPAAAAQSPAKPDTPAASAKEPATPAQANANAGADAKAKPAARPRVAKAKPKPAPARNAARPASPAAASSAPAAEPAPVAETVAPPSPPPSSDGALGFVKRTVNSVGSTITNLGRNAIGN